MQYVGIDWACRRAAWCAVGEGGAISAEGVVLGLTLASEIGDVARFPTPRKLVGYAGLAARVNQSGDRSRTGALSKVGSRTLRWAAVEAAHAAWRPSNPWHRHYTEIAKRAGKNPAKSAVARKVPTASWHILSREQPFKPARSQTSGPDVPASSSCSLAARRPRMELRSRGSSHEQSAHQRRKRNEPTTPPTREHPGPSPATLTASPPSKRKRR